MDVMWRQQTVIYEQKKNYKFDALVTAKKQWWLPFFFFFLFPQKKIIFNKR